MLVSRALTRLHETYPDLEIERVDVVTQPGRAWQEGIRMIPSLRCGDRILSGIYLSEEQIRHFIEAEKKD